MTIIGVSSITRLSPYLIMCAWALIVAIIAMIVAIRICSKDLFVASGIIVAGAVLIALVIRTSGAHELPTGRYRYEAVITSEIKLPEILSAYDIVGRTGEVYILEERNE